MNFFIIIIMPIKTLKNICIGTLVAHPRYINFTLLNMPLIGEIQRQLYGTIEVVVVCDDVLGAILSAHYRDRLNKYKITDTYIISIDTIEECDGEYKYGRLCLDTNVLQKCGFDIELMWFTSNIIDASAYNIIMTMYNTRYNKVRYTTDGNRVIGKFDKYPSINIVVQDNCIFRDIIDNKYETLYYIRENHRTKWLRSLYPKLVSIPINLTKTHSKPQLYVENTLYDKVIWFLINNLHIIDLTILPLELIDTIVARLNEKNKYPVIRGYLILRTNVVKLCKIEYYLQSRKQSSYILDSDLSKYGLSICDVYSDCAKLVTPYTNIIIRNMHNLHLSYPPGHRVKKINERKFMLIKQSSEAYRLRNKYNCNGIQMFSDLIDIPVDLTGSIYY